MMYSLKKLFGDNERKEISLNFLSSILLPEDKYFTNINFEDREFNPIYIDGKLSRLDVFTELNDGSLVDIEVQVCRENYMAERSLYYLSKVYAEALKKGEHYNKLRRAIAINLLDFNLLESEISWHNIVHFALDKSHAILTDCIEIHFLELPKLKFSDVKKLKRAEVWGAYLSGTCSEKQMEELMMMNPEIKKAKTYEEVFRGNKQLRDEYIARENAIFDEKMRTIGARHLGQQEEKKNNIINGLKAGIDIDTISVITNASIEDILKIQKELSLL